MRSSAPRHGVSPANGQSSIGKAWAGNPRGRASSAAAGPGGRSGRFGALSSASPVENLFSATRTATSPRHSPDSSQDPPPGRGGSMMRAMRRAKQTDVRDRRGCGFAALALGLGIALAQQPAAGVRRVRRARPTSAACGAAIRSPSLNGRTNSRLRRRRAAPAQRPAWPRRDVAPAPGPPRGAGRECI